MKNDVTHRARRSGRVLACTLAIILTASCDDARRSGVDDADGVAAPGTEYTRQMIFVAADATGAASLEFTATEGVRTVQRSARGWTEDGSGWRTLFDLAWQDPPVRRAWRLVPHGPIRLRVGFGDVIEAIVVRDEQRAAAASLESGDFIAEWAPWSTAQVVLREGALVLGSEPIPGWLVDARFGVTPQAEADPDSGTPNGIRPPARVTPAAAEVAQDDEPLDSLPTAPPDSTDPEPRGDVMPGGSLRIVAVRGVLVGPAGETLVLADTDTGVAGWLWTEDGETTLPIVTLTAAADAGESWSIEAGGGTALDGTLEVMDQEPAPLSPRIVRGTVRTADAELDMHGVLLPEVGG